MKKRLCFIAIILLTITHSARSQSPGERSYISTQNGPGYFQLSANGTTAPLYVSQADYAGVTLAAKSLQKDIKTVTRSESQLITEIPNKAKFIVLIGTLGKDPLIDKLVEEKKIDVNDIKGKWEAHLTQVVQNPMPGVNKALVITGSDKRGTIYGIYDLSAQIGVSPWYWWADVPVKEKKALYVLPGRYTDGEPAVKYRGIFINDEAPAFSGWAREKFGGVNHLVYEKIFELILRLKGNYLWPAMWGNAFNDDDKLDPILADEYGIVMGTSHHEPMDRAQQEWKRYGKGAWNYDTNGEELREFWKKGIENMGNKETIVTVGMRGDGDMPMTEGSNIALLERIVHDQRKIIADVTGKDTAQTPQMWALYKEVQDYYDKGMRVPDDVTLLLCDDNWGNIRKLPKLNEPKRKGGYGIYYHFDYVGAPRNYKWLNTNTIAKTWEQMHLAYEYNARQVWIVNVGDLRPMEYPISFFLDYAWNPKRWPADQLHSYSEQWAAQQFGSAYAKEIANILARYTRYNSRRKPELLNENTYSLTNYNEFASIVAEYNQLRDEAQKLYDKMPEKSKDAFYELVLHPVLACSNLNELYFETAKNHYYTKYGNVKAANEAAAKVKALYQNDKDISNYYNKQLAGGKWDHMMDQTHIGYTYWQEPRVNKMPEVIELNPDSVKNTNSAFANVEFKPVPEMNMSTGSGAFIEKEGFVSIEAPHFSKAVSLNNIGWKVIPDYGNTLGGVMPSPVTAARIKPSAGMPHLEFQISLKDTGNVSVVTCVSPTLDFRNKDGLFFAISIDNETPQLVNIATKVDSKEWAEAVSDNIRKLVTRHHISKPGTHVLKYWMVDPAVVVQKIMIDAGGLKPSYLGPPESPRR